MYSYESARGYIVTGGVLHCNSCHDIPLYPQIRNMFFLRGVTRGSSLLGPATFSRCYALFYTSYDTCHVHVHVLFLFVTCNNMKTGDSLHESPMLSHVTS